MEIGKERVVILGLTKVIIEENGLLIRWMGKGSMLIQKLSLRGTLKMTTLSNLWIDFHHYILNNIIITIYLLWITKIMLNWNT
jgi:hypothetical protein